MSEQVAIQEEAVTVSILAARLNGALQRAFPGSVVLEAELSNFKAYPSGHWYFTLTDGQASLSAVMFKGNARSVRLVARDGLQVRVACEVNFYPPNGRLQLIVKRMDEAGLGDQRKSLDALRAKLVAEGLTELSRKRRLPAIPRVIGLITSPKGAVISDMLVILNRRWPIAEIRLYSASVQGETAAAELSAALQRAIDDNRCDVLVIGRGGGSSEDFAAFHDESLVRRVAACPIPIVSAVGHETDTGLTDLVADVRAATPSQAAELVSPDCRELFARINQWLNRLAGRADTQIALAEQRLELVEHRLTETGKSLIRERSERIERLVGRLIAPTEYIARRRMDVTIQIDRLTDRVHRMLETRTMELSRLSGQLDVLSPLATLGRGYGIILQAADSPDRTIGSINQITPGQAISVHLKDGAFQATVDHIEQEK